MPKSRIAVASFWTTPLSIHTAIDTIGNLTATLQRLPGSVVDPSTRPSFLSAVQIKLRVGPSPICRTTFAAAASGSYSIDKSDAAQWEGGTDLVVHQNIRFGLQAALLGLRLRLQVSTLRCSVMTPRSWVPECKQGTRARLFCPSTASTRGDHATVTIPPKSGERAVCQPATNREPILC
ncbi:hypothetical protein IWZ03DRAFT_15962 [Phyllosticta citriasiana]|uniref:Uncharacterized protein n=2 Tax=Phyllosticta citriasiana TaxID=595635 RepID=A0ABR1KYR8_9PEZI